MVGTIRAGASRVAAFVYRQKRNYRVAVVRSAANRFLASHTDRRLGQPGPREWEPVKAERSDVA